MTGATSPHHQVVIHLFHWVKEIRVMASATIRHHRNMIRGLADGTNIVMTRGTILADPVVVKARRLPTEIRVAIHALVVHGNMIYRFAGHNDIVVAILAATKHLVVIDHRDRLPGHGAVAGIAALAGKNMLHGLGGGIDQAVDTVTGSALLRRTGKLAAHMAAFAGHEVVSTSQIETGCRVIEGFALRLHQSADTSHQRH